MQMIILLLGCLLSQLVNATTLLVGMEDANNAPFEYLDERGQLTGFHVELLSAVTHRLGWHLTLQRYPWNRAILLLEHGEVQALSYFAKSPERETFAIFLPGNQLHTSRTTFFIKRTRAAEIHYLPDLEQMARRWRMAMPSGYHMSDEVVTLIKRGVPIAQPTVPQSQLFRMLMANRFDTVLGATTALQTAKAEIPDIDQEVQRLDGSLMPGTSMYLAFSRQTPAQLAEDFAQAYRLFRQEPEYLALAQRFGVTELLPTADDFK